MLNSKKKALLLLFLLVSLLYIWTVVLVEHEWIRVLGSSIAPVIVAIISSRLCYRTYKRSMNKDKLVWLLFSIGLLFHSVGNAIWFVGAFNHLVYRAPDISYAFWLIAYFIFLAALLYKIRLIKPILENPYLSNTLIFLIIITALIVHYSVSPYLQSTKDMFEVIVIGFLFPLADIGLIFVTTLLYYLLRNSKDRVTMLFVLAGFYMQILGDMLAVGMKTNNEYYQLLIEPIWVGSLLLIGYASVFTNNESSQYNEEDLIIGGKESLFPYLSAFLLFLLVFHNHQWRFDALSAALILVFSFIIIRQLIILGKNKRLLLNYHELAYHDSITGLSNRMSFHVDLEATIKWAKKEERLFFILLIDLDRFKMVNDTLGHFVGDRVLKVAANILRQSIERDCCVYRLGGDEFVIILPGKDSETNYQLVAERIIEAFNRSFEIEGHEITITASIGISSYPYSGKDGLSLFKAADTAMYLAKGRGRNNFQLFDSQLNEELTRKVKIERELRKAIERKELELFYQPKVKLSNGELIGMEALLRWNNKELGLVSPTEFIPVAEDSGLIVELGEWVIKEAFHQNKKWQDEGFPALRMSVNVSVQQFRHSNIIGIVSKNLAVSGLNSKYIELEITESIMQNVEESRNILEKLKILGVKIALDDFGTGYSSLYILKSLPIDTLKIDQAFINDMKESENQSLVKGIIDIAKNLNLAIVAEGVEHKYQVDALISYNCCCGQGYYFAKPMDKAAFEEYMYAHCHSKRSLLESYNQNNQIS